MRLQRRLQRRHVGQGKQHVMALTFGVDVPHGGEQMHLAKISVCRFQPWTNHAAWIIFRADDDNRSLRALFTIRPGRACAHPRRPVDADYALALFRPAD